MCARREGDGSPERGFGIRSGRAEEDPPGPEIPREGVDETSSSMYYCRRRLCGRPVRRIAFFLFYPFPFAIPLSSTLLAAPFTSSRARRSSITAKLQTLNSGLPSFSRTAR